MHPSVQCSYHCCIYILREETVPAVHVVNPGFHLCISLVHRPMIVVFGLGTRPWPEMMHWQADIL